MRLQQNCKYNSKMLINLINDMMDLAKSERMKFELNNSFFDLQQLVERSFENLGYMAIEKEVNLGLKINQQILPFVKNINGDENRFTQIFLNFLSNALKFSP
jgi:signal transduction histidine kinase